MDSLVSTDWLAGELGAPDIRIVDASWHLPDTGRDARAEYEAGHIPGALFLDLGTLSDENAPVDNTLPGAEKFAARMSALGIGEADRIVLYDDSAVKSAARAWFMLRLFGARKVAILDGGLAKWKAEGRVLASGSQPAGRGQFTARADRTPLRDKQAMLANLSSQAEHVADARGTPRFKGEMPEPRAGVEPGHIPGSRNLPYTELFGPDGTFKDPAAIRDAFAKAGIDLARPVVASCGSGVTACVLLFAMDLLGKRDVALYDGSWGEWGADPHTPKATGAA